MATSFSDGESGRNGFATNGKAATKSSLAAHTTTASTMLCPSSSFRGGVNHSSLRNHSMKVKKNADSLSPGKLRDT